MLISDWSSDVCSSDLPGVGDGRVPVRGRNRGDRGHARAGEGAIRLLGDHGRLVREFGAARVRVRRAGGGPTVRSRRPQADHAAVGGARIPPTSTMTPSVSPAATMRSEEHTSELQSLMRISYAVFCLKKKTHNSRQTQVTHTVH